MMKQKIDKTILNLSLIKILTNLFVKDNVTFVLVANTQLKYLLEHTITEKKLLTIDFSPAGVGNRINWLLNKPKHFDKLYCELPHYNLDYIKNIFEPIQNISTKRGRMNVDYHSKYLNITNGFRHTVGQPTSYEHSIFIVGGSSVYGYGAEDKHTLPSYLQKEINTSIATKDKYSVFNLGARGAPKFVDFHKLLNLKVNAGDIVIFQGIVREIIEQLLPYQSKYFHTIIPDLSHKEDEEIFFDAEHVVYKGNKLIAQQIYHQLFFSDTQTKKIPFDISYKEEKKSLTALERFTKQFTQIFSNLAVFPELKIYLQQLEQVKNENNYNGAAVVNCNPFTLGHKYFLEYAASKVDHLYVFIVEENLSYFDFPTRYDLVVQGLKDLKNITILRSGKFIMSTTTYPEYFSKNEVQYTTLDASKDMDIFGEYIAPILKIQKRFIGEEPFCKITNEHNKQMRQILPTYGINIEEVKRIKYKKNVISASLVRKYLQNKEMDKIKDLVPKTTFDYLEKVKI